MRFHFTNKHLKTLYIHGESRKYRLDKQVIRGFFEVVAAIDGAGDIYDLQLLPSLRFEKMKGYQSRFSLRITRKYRLEIEIEWVNQEKTVGIVGIEELSKHYE